VIRIKPGRTRLRAGITRRALLRFGGLGPLGLGIAAARARPANATEAGASGRAKSLLVISLYGGPAHQDLWDLKREAPAEVRGDFRPIKTSVPGVEICEHLPRLATLAHQYALVRSVSHADNGHRSAAYSSFTGWPHPAPNTDPLPHATDYPGYGATVSLLRPPAEALPPHVVVGSAFIVDQLPGERAGFLGPLHDPFVVLEDPNLPTFSIPELVPLRTVGSPRLDRRRALLQRIDDTVRLWERAAAAGGLAGFQQRAFSVLASSRLRAAFDLGAEEARLRDRYGRTTPGQSLLLARRLIEAGVPCVTVNWHREAGVWDLHSNNFAPLKEQLLPELDGSISAPGGPLHARAAKGDAGCPGG
jgi:hypothetical protein